MSKIKRWWLLLIIAIIAAFLLEIIQINTQPKASVYAVSEQLTEQEKNIYPNQITGISGYCITGQELIVEEEDPQMYFSIENSGLISYVYFHFESVSKAEMRIQIFYPGEDGVYTEANSVVSECPAGVDFWPIEIPAAEYSALRIDIDGSSIPLKSIGTGIIPPEVKRIIPGIHWVRVVIVAILLFAVLFWMAWCEIWTGMKKAIQGGIRGIRENKKRSILYALAFPVAVGISVFLFWLFCTVFAGKPMTSPRIVFAILIGAFVACLFVLRKTLKTQPEYLFLILVICLGLLFCYYIPHTGLNGWDEDYHYARALETSYVDSVIITQQDEATIARNVSQSYDLNGDIQTIHERQDELYKGGATEQNTGLSTKDIPEFFNGIGLFLGRILGLRYYMILVMGRFFGILSYAIVGYFAIRKLKSGKMIAAVALLIPTEIFIASTFNYDSYLTSFTALGLCYYIAQWQNRGTKLSLKDAIIMIGSITFGCMTKQVYIPLLWILFLLPRNKFIDKKHHTYYVLSIIAATGFIAFTYVLPAVLGKGEIGQADLRGGSDISVGRQISYIFSHPLDFIGVIWRQIINEYLDLNRLGEILTNMAYHGIMPNQYIYLGLIVAVAFTDKNENDKELTYHPWAHIWPILVSIGTIILVITSMYLIFTPVGLDRVNGAQFRYLIPMFIPIMMHVGSGLVENKMNRGWYNGIVLSVAAFVGFSCVYNAFICKYF